MVGIPTAAPNFLLAEETAITDVVHVLSQAISIIQQGTHSPLKAHERVKDFYSWSQIAERTEKVHEVVLSSPSRDLWERMQRCAFYI